MSRSRHVLSLALLLAATPSTPILAGNSDGQTDFTFGSSGTVTWYDGGAVTVADLATSSTGAYAVGTVTLVGEEPALHFKGFDSGGDELGQGCAQTSDTLFTLATESNGLAGLIDSTGNLVVGGWAAFLGTETTRRALVARFDLSGTGCDRDESFSGNGWAIFDDETWCDTESCDVIDLVEMGPEIGYVVAPRIVALVRSKVNTLVSRFFLLGLTASGAIDTTFSSDGWTEVTTAEIGSLYPEASLAVDGNGQLYVLAARYEPSTVDIDTVLFRYQVNGSIDPGFGVGGSFLLGNDGPNDAFDPLPRDVAIGPNGAAISVYQRDADEAVTHAWVDEDLHSDAETSVHVVASVALQGNGRVVNVGEHGNGSDGFTLERRTLVNDGSTLDLSLDGSFGALSGTHNYDIDLGGSNSETASAVAIWNGRALVAGTAASSVGNAGFLLRTQNAFIFADSFEQGNAAYWSSSIGVVFPD